MCSSCSGAGKPRQLIRAVGPSTESIRLPAFCGRSKERTAFTLASQQVGLQSAGGESEAQSLPSPTVIIFALGQSQSYSLSGGRRLLPPRRHIADQSGTPKGHPLDNVLFHRARHVLAIQALVSRCSFETVAQHCRRTEVSNLDICST